MSGVFPEHLGLDPDVLRRIAAAAEDFASSVLRTEEDPVDAEAYYDWGLQRASLLVEAAACHSFTSDARRTRFAFSSAAAAYGTIRHPFGAICAIASDGLAPVEPGGIDPASDALSAAYMFARSEDQAPDRSEVRSRHAVGALPVGELQIPVSLYDEVARAASEGASWPETRRAIMEVAERAAEALDLAMQDSYHWQRLQSGLLPAEPELVALGVIAAHIGTARDVTGLRRALGRLSSAPAIAVGLSLTQRPEMN